jgi:hypothetical protein
MSLTISQGQLKTNHADKMGVVQASPYARDYLVIESTFLSNLAESWEIVG